MEDWAQWATALVAVLAYRWGWARGARKMAAAVAQRATWSQKVRIWAEEKFTPDLTPTLSPQQLFGHLQRQEEDAHAGHSHEGGAAPRGQYL